MGHQIKWRNEMRNMASIRAGMILAAGWLCGLGAVEGQTPQPLVAVHDSELTRALETMVFTNSPATDTGYQWWLTNWHYFFMPDSVKEALRSDGTAFTVVGDSNIISGQLVN